ncbi:hypothetical protein [Aeromonas hydrophila]
MKIGVQITHWQYVPFMKGALIKVPAKAVVVTEHDAANDSVSKEHVELLAAAMIAQARELRDCGPAEWSSFSDMVEGALNNIRVDVGVLHD